MKKQNDIGKMRIQKTISIDLDLLRRTIEESEDMQRDFSSTISILVTMGLAVREAQRSREKEVITEMSKKV